MPRRRGSQLTGKYLARSIHRAVREFKSEKEISNTLRERVKELEREKENPPSPIERED